MSDNYYRPENVHRVILKISGEFLAGEAGFGIDHAVVDRISDEIIEIKRMGFAVGIVLGGGNFFRGISGTEKGISRITGDNVGMLATIQNSLIISDYIQKKNYQAEIYSAIQLPKFTKFYAPERAERSLEEGKICLFCSGTGNPYFTTDTAAVLRAVELKADLILKGTKVDGVYSSDPKINSDATFYEKISYDEVISQNLRVMDLTAFSLAKENNISIKIFNLTVPGNIKKALLKKNIGSFIS
ncbi:MAG: UMP kinase [Candidatus Cloacimonetes bacterium]|nr:UMP kinase [Candidatus Cloacimonadota bacterium]